MSTEQSSSIIFKSFPDGLFKLMTVLLPFVAKLPRSQDTNKAVLVSLAISAGGLIYYYWKTFSEAKRRQAPLVVRECAVALCILCLFLTVSTVDFFTEYQCALTSCLMTILGIFLYALSLTPILAETVRTLIVEDLRLPRATVSTENGKPIPTERIYS